jgi:membrane-associated PAP2 superfamily phosphatase
MNRTGLCIALALAAIIGIVFGLFPELDLWLAGLFFDGSRPNGFLPRAWVRYVRDTSMWVIALFAVVPALAVILKLLLPRTRMLVPGRAVIFLLATLAIGPGLIVNVVLKDSWSRSRPIDVGQFGGEERFVAWWDPRGNCPRNCSFVTGDGSGAFWTLAPAALTPPAWRPLAYGAALTFGAVIGVMRMSFGGHFFTDVAFAGIISFLLIWLVHGLLYRWPATRITDEAVEGALERAAMPLHDVLRGGRRGAGPERSSPLPAARGEVDPRSASGEGAQPRA